MEGGTAFSAKTADAFHQHETCLGRQLPISGRDAVGVDRPARVRRRQVGGDRRIETIGIDQRPFRRDGTGFDEPLDVFVAAGLVNAGGHRLHRQRAQPVRPRRVQQRAGREGFADFRIRAGQEPGLRARHSMTS